MDSRVSGRQMGVKLNIDQARTRQTPKTDFGTVMKTGLSKTADVAMAAGSIAAPFVPGGAVVSAAISGMSQMKDMAGGGGGGGGLGSASGAMTGMSGSANSMTLGGNSSAMGGSGNSAFSAVNQLAASGDPNANMFNATKAMQEMNMSQNLQYLQLQQDMQQDNRQFTLVSNIMKVKHDTAKNAINNVR